MKMLTCEVQIHIITLCTPLKVWYNRSAMNDRKLPERVTNDANMRKATEMREPSRVPVLQLLLLPDQIFTSEISEDTQGDAVGAQNHHCNCCAEKSEVSGRRKTPEPASTASVRPQLEAPRLGALEACRVDLPPAAHGNVGLGRS